VFHLEIIPRIQVIDQVIIDVIQAFNSVIIQMFGRSVAVSDRRSRHVVVDGDRWRLWMDVGDWWKKA